MPPEDPERPGIQRILTGAAIGLVFGAFVSVPWGTFAGPDAPGWQLALPVVLGFSVLGAWVAYVSGLAG